MDAVEQAKSGHPGMPMGMADIATVLFTQFLPFDPRASEGQTATGLYCRAELLLALTRQSLPLLRRAAGTENRSARGAYVLAEADGERQVTLLATVRRFRFL